VRVGKSNTAGLTLSVEPAKLPFVTGVRAGSPAAQAGVVAGLSLVAFNGIVLDAHAGKIPANILSSLAEKHTKMMCLELVRGGKAHGGVVRQKKKRQKLAPAPAPAPLPPPPHPAAGRGGSVSNPAKTPTQLPARLARHPTNTPRNQKALHAAAVLNQTPAIVRMVSMNVDPNAADCDNYTALHFATFNGHASASKALMQHGTRLCTQTLGAQMSALHFAAASHNEDLVANLVNSHIQQQAFCARRTSSPAAPTPPLPGVGAPAKAHKSTASLPQQIERLIDLKNSDGDTALHIAVRTGHYKTVRTLIRLGADMSTANNAGDTLIHTSIYADAHQGIVATCVRKVL